MRKSLKGSFSKGVLGAVCGFVLALCTLALAIGAPFASADPSIPESTVTLYGGNVDGSEYLQPGESAKLYVCLHLKDVKNGEAKSNVSFQFINSMEDQGIHVKTEGSSVKLQKLVWDGEDNPKFEDYAKAFTDEGTKQKLQDDTSNLDNGRYDNKAVLGTIKNMQPNELYYVTFDVDVEASATVAGSCWFICSTPESNRAIVGFVLGRPKWASEITLGGVEGIKQAGDTFTVKAKATMHAAEAVAKEGTLTVVLPKGISPQSPDDLPTATVSAKPLGQAAAATLQTGKGESSSVEGGTQIVWTVDSGVLTDKVMAKGSYVEVSLPVKVDAGAQGTLAISAKGASAKTNDASGDATATVECASPILSVTAVPDKTMAQAGDTITWTVTATETGGSVDCAEATVTPTWGTHLTGGESTLSMGKVAAGQTVTKTISATVASGTAASEDDIAPTFKLTGINVSEVEAAKVPIDAVEPQLTLERGNHPASGRVGETVTIHVHVGNSSIGSHADSVKVTDTLPEGWTPVAGSAKVMDGTDDSLQTAAPDAATDVQVTSNGAEATFTSVTPDKAYVFVYEANVKPESADGSKHEGTARSTYTFDSSEKTAESKSTFTVSEITLAVSQSEAASSNRTPTELRSDDYTQAGETVTFDVTVSSTGTKAPGEVTVEGDLSDAATLASVTKGGIPVVKNGNKWSSTISDLSSPVTFKVTATVEAGHAGNTLKHVVMAKTDGVADTRSESDLTIVAPVLEISRTVANKTDAESGTYAQAGDELTYTASVTQTAEHAWAADVKLEDVPVAGIVPIEGTGKVTSGESAYVTIERDGSKVAVTKEALTKDETLSFAYDAKVADSVPTGPLSNTASVTADFLSTVTAEATVTIVAPEAELTWVEEPSAMAQGETKTFTAKLANRAEHSRLDSIEVKDTSSASFVTSSALSPQLPIRGGEERELTLTVASAKGGDHTLGIEVERRGETIASLTSPVHVKAADLEAWVELSPSVVQAGDAITGTLHVVNDGDDDATAVSIETALPSGLAFESTPDAGDSGATVTLENGNRTLKVGFAELGSSQSAEFPLSIKVAESGVETGSHDVTTKLTATSPGLTETFSVPITVGEPDVSVTSSVAYASLAGREPLDDSGAYRVAGGETAVVEIRLEVVQGANSLPLKAYTVSTKLPERLSFDPAQTPSVAKVAGGDSASTATLSKADDPAGVSVSFAGVLPGEAYVVRVPVKVADDFKGTDSVSMSVDHGKSADALNGHATVSLVAYPIVLSATKTASVEEAKAGDKVDYTITVRQTSPQASAVGVEVEDVIPSELTLSEEGGWAHSDHPSSVVTYDEGTRTLKVTAPALAEGESLVIDFDATVGEVSAWPVSNVASAKAANATETVTATADLFDHVHQWSEWVDDGKATCEAGGTKTRHCEVMGCSEEQTEPTGALGHDWTIIWETTDEPTCTEQGSQTEHRKCNRCQSEVTGETRTVEPLGHDSAGEPIVSEKAATCTEPGLRTEIATCSRCGAEGETTSYDIAALGHDWSTSDRCSRCGEPKPEESCDHVWGDWADVTPATCEEGGTQTRVCTVCGASDRCEVAALGHGTEADTVREDVVAEPTCTEPGAKVVSYICGRCGKVYHTEEHTVAALGHDWHGGVCSRCGAEAPAEHIHEWGEWEVVDEPTCLVEGERARYCRFCGASERETISALGHDFDAETHLCKRCGATDGTWVVEPGEVDLSELRSAIAQAKGLKASDWTDETWEALANALARAETVLTAENLTQADVDDATDALKAAIDGLEPARAGGGSGTSDDGGGGGSNPGSSGNQLVPPSPQTPPTVGSGTTGDGVVQKVVSKMPQTGAAAFGAAALFCAIGTGGAVLAARAARRDRDVD